MLVRCGITLSALLSQSWLHCSKSLSSMGVHIKILLVYETSTICQSHACWFTNAFVSVGGLSGWGLQWYILLTCFVPTWDEFSFFGKQLRTCLSFMGTSVSVSLFPVLREPMNSIVTAFSNSAVLKLVVCIK